MPGSRVTTAVLGAAGALAALAVAVSGSPVASGRVSGLAALARRAVPALSGPGHGRLAAAAAAVLVAAWLLALGAARRWSERTVWSLAGLWTLPAALGAPLLSADVYAYLAQGRLLARGLDPYRVGPDALGHSPALLAVAPAYRHAPAPYGSVALLLTRAADALGGGTALPLAALVVLSVAAVAATGLAVRALCPPQWRTTALAGWLLSPVAVLYLAGGVHVDAVLAAVGAACVLALVRGRPVAAAALGGLAGAVKAPGLVLVALACLEPWSTPAGGRVRRGAVRLLTAAGVYVAAALAVGDVTGPVRGLRYLRHSRTLAAPTSVLAQVLGRLSGHRALAEQAGARAAGLAVAGVVVAALLVTARRRSAPATAGWALLAVALLGPVFYPWYLAWSLPLLLCVPRVPVLRWAAVVTTAGSLSGLPGLHRAGAAADVAAALVAVALLVTAARAPGARARPPAAAP